MNGSKWMVIAALLGGSGVALGAFGAHGLEGAIEGWISEPALVERRLDNWEAAVRYQMYHALAMLGLGLLALLRGRSRLLDFAGGCFLLGPGFFSGGLYLLVLSYAWSSGWTWLGMMVVPIGGLLMIAGWLLLAIAAWKSAP